MGKPANGKDTDFLNPGRRSIPVAVPTCKAQRTLEAIFELNDSVLIMTLLGK